ncbi:chromophore lyase CpcT/CpeT [candidate division WOR-3 bacterium]|nr:chromophore lyase CpcT/CpeT [candidate division WOR-3 bacterium]
MNFLLILLPLFSEATEIANYRDLKQSLFGFGHKVTFSVRYDDEKQLAKLYGQVENAHFTVSLKKREAEFISYWLREILSGELEKHYYFRIYKDKKKKNGTEYNVFFQIRTISLRGSQKGKVVGEENFYLLLGREICFFDNTIARYRERYEPSDLELFLAWFEGEFDNYKQRIEDISNERKNSHSLIHFILTPVDMPHFKGYTFYSVQYLDGNPEKVYRQRIYEVDWDAGTRTVIVRTHKFPDNEEEYRNAHLHPEILENLRPEDLKSFPGCDIYWERRGDRFYGRTKKGSCLIISSDSGRKLSISVDMVLFKDAFWILENTIDENGNIVYGRFDGVHNKLNRCHFFKGWVYFEEGKKGDTRKFKIENFHNQGKKVRLVCRETGKILYILKLSQANLKENESSVLRLEVFKGEEKKPVLSVWCEPDAKQIGVDLGWFKADLMRVGERLLRP